MFGKIIKVVVAVLVIFAGVVLIQSSDFRVSRSAVISAPTSLVFRQVNELRNWEAWSPWEKLDPAMKKTYEGASAGLGASSSWAGNSQVGEGRSTITESRPHDIVRIKLEFRKPFTATNDVVFTFKPEDDKTIVSWTMTGKKNFLAKAVSLFMDCEQMVGDQFELGLSNLKKVVEVASKV